ncbi:relaxase/mobilization nuclease domain-containing protein [Sinomicrobium oceani]|uniref:relaxase/mobilization nuclease domain-containing protein n=1 Tax=Sinomicrobium oceani TaxID=1150368 RepID=UPI00227B557B|nr:relaxase/mobilization nuclease domain-containing protein [Sinomicrobium oceani]
MVAVIKTGNSIHRAFNYNENKVKEGVARCIGQGNYPVEAKHMSLTMKLNRLLRQAELNQNVKRNSVHISLNFAPSENPSDEKMKAIADSYMEKIGFGEQPYLVYRHEDAGHSHLHIVSIKVRADGSRIDMNNIGKNQSEQARKAIEEAFGLVKAETQKQVAYQLQPVHARRVQYGKSATKRTIQNVLIHVLDTYKYASLPELNAILNQYNIHADRGKETSRMYRNGGLVYKVLGAQGKPVGVPIKASLFYNTPTLKSLEKKFSKNKLEKTRYKTRLKNTINKVLFRQENKSLEAFIKVLDKQGIHTVLRQNEEGRLYGITFVDHRTQSVFNGSELGKQYGAKAIQERLGLREVSEPNIHSARKPGLGLQPQHTAAETKDTIKDEAPVISEKETETVLDLLLQPEQVVDYLPYHLKKDRTKKKKKRKKG